MKHTPRFVVKSDLCNIAERTIAPVFLRFDTSLTENDSCHQCFCAFKYRWCCAMHVNVDGTVCAGKTNTIKLAGSGCLFVLVKIMIVASHI